jgi:DNA-binding CsgD family transcriptional regulator/tetratricopeptide (TPR) repeat protein
LENALLLYRELSDAVGEAGTLDEIAWVALYRGRYEQARDWWNQALEIARPCENQRLLAGVLLGLSLGISADRDYGCARALAEESLALWEGIGDRIGISRALGHLSLYALWESDFDHAQELAEACGLISDEGWGVFTPIAQQMLGHVALERGAYQQAAALFQASLAHVVPTQEWMVIAQSLEGLAGAVSGLGDLTAGATLLGAAAGIRERFGTPVPPPWQDYYDRALATLLAGRDNPAFAAAWSAGQRFSPFEAIEYGLALDVHPVAVDASAHVSRLTTRERDVLRLLVDGRSNREIAERLFLSPRTVANHVSSIMSKLGLESRTAAASWAIRQGLV